VPLLAMSITFILTKKLPDVYSAKGSIAAGILDGSQQGVAAALDKNFLQDAKVNQEFSNLIQIMQMKKVYDQLSYQLILHDLTTDKPFRPLSKLVKELNAEAKKHAIEVFTAYYKAHEPLSLWDNDQKGLNQVIASMGYDYDALTKKIKVYRIEASDFVTVEAETESPTLSAYMVNTLCGEFIDYYTDFTRENEQHTIHFLQDMLTQKKDSLDTQVNGLRNFKIDNRVLNLEEQAKILHGQIADFENRIELTEKDIAAHQGALDMINHKFDSHKEEYLDSKLAPNNREIASLTEQIKQMTIASIKAGDGSYKSRIDSLKSLLSQKINQNSDKYVINPVTTKENLVAQKMNMEVDLELSKSSLKSLQDELKRLNARFDTLVPHEAVIQKYEGSISVASQEYLEVLKNYNQATMAYNSSSKIKQIELAMPGPPQPSKKMLLVGVGGVGSLVMCLLVLFVVFYIDESINLAQELANKTDQLVLGYLPILNNVSVLNMNYLWRHDNETPESKAFKTQLRSMRFETDNELSGAHILGITSLAEGEGKTFLAMSLASAHLMINKKVLLIDGNFTNPTITQLLQPEHFLEDYLNGKSNMPYPGYENDITVIGNRGTDTSLFEVATEQDIKAKMDALRDVYDVIIVECSSLDTLNLSKEWINMADKVMAVFEAGQTLTNPGKNQIEYLRSQGNKFIGWAINKVRSEYLPGGGKPANKTRKARA